jgi:predicted amidohydrolase
MHVAIIQPDVTFEDALATQATIDTMIEAATIPPGALIVLPEMTDTGVTLHTHRVADGPTMAWAAELAKGHRCWVAAGWATNKGSQKTRNVLSFFAPDGSVVSSYAKVFPCSPMGESAAYQGGDNLAVQSISTMTMAGLICYDLRFPELWRLAMLAGAEAFVLIANWPARRRQHWRALCIARAIENQAWVIACNRVGSDPNTAYAGGSLVISPTGEVVAEGSEDAQIITAQIDSATVTADRTTFPVLDDLRRDLLGSIAINSPDTLLNEPPS